MRPGDYITVNASEVDVLTSDTFREVAPEELVRRIRLADDPERPDYQRLELPKIGMPVAEVLRGIAAGSATPTAQSVVAGHLAERIEARVRR